MKGARTVYRFGTVTNIPQVKVAVVKLRLIVLSLALMSLIVVIAGSFLYYGIIKKTVLAEANRRAVRQARSGAVGENLSGW